MRSFHVFAAITLGALATSGPALASGLMYNGPDAYGAYGYARPHHGPVAHGGGWRQAPAPRRSRADFRRGVVVGAVAGAVVGGVAVAAARPRPVVYTDGYYSPAGYYPQPAPAYQAAPVYRAQAYPAQPYCFHQREHLFNSQGVYRGVFPVRVCQ